MTAQSLRGWPCRRGPRFSHLAGLLGDEHFYSAAGVHIDLSQADAHLVNAVVKYDVLGLHYADRRN
jgi:hypothetical protein